MKSIKKILLGFVKYKKIKINNKSNYIFYKIINYINEQKAYVIQCINTKAIFRSKITDLVFDTDLLYGLHPIQACYIGIEYIINMNKTNCTKNQKYQKKTKEYSIYRYGEYSLLYQKRNGDFCFINNFTNEEFIMDPWEIALSEELIREFDAVQAFHIGCMAGHRICHDKNSYEKPRILKKINLRVIK